MKVSVCVDAVFEGRDFFESLETLSALGIRNFEFWRWWDKDIDRIRQEKDRLQLQISSFCTRFISLVDASKREEYIQGLRETIETAKMLGCKHIITQVGDELSDRSREQQHQSLVEGLKACIPYLREADITLLVEPLNTMVDHQGYFLSSSDEGCQVIEEVNDPHVKLLFDIYHQQIMEGHLISRIRKNIRFIGHFHAAGNPGRHELHNGEINYESVFEAIEKTGYQGYIALEYFPLEDPSLGLEKVVQSKIGRGE